MGWYAVALLLTGIILADLMTLYFVEKTGMINVRINAFSELGSGEHAEPMLQNEMPQTESLDDTGGLQGDIVHLLPVRRLGAPTEVRLSEE